MTRPPPAGTEQLEPATLERWEREDPQVNYERVGGKLVAVPTPPASGVVIEPKR